MEQVLSVQQTLGNQQEVPKVMSFFATNAKGV
jgi:hypothetical protein